MLSNGLLIDRIRLLPLLLLFALVLPATGTTLNLSQNELPDCSTNWSVSGSTYTCTNDGRTTLSSGISLIAETNSTLIANNGFELNGSTIGTEEHGINLVSDYGTINSSGSTQLQGNVTSNSGNISLENTEVLGSLTITNGTISLNESRITGEVHSSCCTITAQNTDLLGGASSNSDTISITGGTLAGDFSTSGGSGVILNSVNMTSGNITTTNVPIDVTSSTLGSETNPVQLSNNHEIYLRDAVVWGEAEGDPGYDSIDLSGTSTVVGNCTPEPTGGQCNTTASTTCSGYHGQATINEIFRSGNQRYIEVKILNTNIPASEFHQWELRACRDPGFCTDYLSLSVADSSTLPWLVFSDTQLPGSGENNVVQLDSDGMDILLRDSNGQTIDYARVTTGANYQDPGACLPAYDWQIQPSNTHLVARIPDGTGDWKVSGPGSSFDEFPPSEGEGNDDVDTPDDQPAVSIDVSNTLVEKGDSAGFSVFLSDTRSYPITVEYATADGADTEAGVDYEATSGTLTFEPDDIAKTVSVPTFEDAPAPPDSFFYLTLSDANPAVIHNHFATATFSEPPPPEDSLEYIELTFDSTALTCQAAEITFRACADENCNTLFTDTVNLTATHTGSGSWTGGVTFSFTGETTRSFARTEAALAILGAANISPTPEGVPQIRCNGGTDCTLEFVNVAFVLTAVSQNLTTLTAGQQYGDLFRLQAIETDNETGACGPALSGETQQVLWSATTVNPDTPYPSDPRNLQIKSETVETGPDSAPTTPIDVSFDNDGLSIEAFTIQYDDAGRLELEAGLTIDMESDELTLRLINDRQLTFWPHRFLFADIHCEVNEAGDCRPGTDPADGDTVDNPEATDHTGSPFAYAGAEFIATIEAHNAQGQITHNFGREGSPGLSVSLTATLLQPDPDDGGNEPGLGGQTTLSASDFEDGTASVPLLWPEVGIIGLTAELDSYLGMNNGPTDSATSEPVGRFIPYEFAVEWLEEPEFNAGHGTFTYQGQPFQWLTAPVLQITALNMAGNPTLNYGGDFYRLDTEPAVSVHGGSAIDLTKIGGPGGNLTASVTPTSSTTGDDVLDGISELALDSTTEWLIQKVIDPESPGTAQIGLSFAASVFTDADDVVYRDGSGSPQGFSHTLTQNNLNWGRLRLRSAQGPEARPLDVPMQIEIWDDGAFEVFELEDSTGTALNSGDFTLNLLGDFTGNLSNTSVSAFAAGEAILTLAEPDGPGAVGRVRVDGTGVPDYLFYPWPHTATGEDWSPPRAIASFGTYEGRPPMLFMLQQGR